MAKKCPSQHCEAEITPKANTILTDQSCAGNDTDLARLVITVYFDLIKENKNYELFLRCNYNHCNNVSVILELVNLRGESAPPPQLSDSIGSFDRVYFCTYILKF